MIRLEAHNWQQRANAQQQPQRRARIPHAQNAIQRAYGLRRRPTPKDVLRIGAPWRPYASVASWYLWRSLENGDGQA